MAKDNKSTESTELITPNPSGGDVAGYEPRHLALTIDRNELNEIVRDNLSGDTLSIGDLTRIKVPAGGSTTWTYDDISGSHDAREIRGIIIHTNLQRAYWKGQFAGAGTLPDCFSPDAEVPTGDPGDTLKAEGKGCDECPFAQFESSDRGRGQACKLTRRIFFLTEDSLLPTLLIAPPASLKTMRQYLTGLAARATPYFAVETSFTLERQTTADGINYARIKVAVAEKLPREEARKIKDYADMIRPALQRTAVIEQIARDVEFSGEAAETAQG